MTEEEAMHSRFWKIAINLFYFKALGLQLIVNEEVLPSAHFEIQQEIHR